MLEESNQINDLILYLFTSRVRIKILNIFIPNPDQMFFVRQVTRLTGEEVNAVRRELERLKKIGLLGTEVRGNRLYYKIKNNFIFYYDLLRIVGKTTGLGYEIIRQQESLGRIKYAMVAAAFVRGRVSSPNFIDLLIVGKINLEVLQNLIRSMEASLKREINYTVMNDEEFEFRKSRQDAFIRSVLSQPQVVLIGDEEELNS